MKYLFTLICLGMSFWASANNMINNYSFEQGEAYWATWGNAVDNSKAHSGSKSLHSKGRGLCTLVANYTSTLSVKKNTYYKYSGYIFRADDSSWAYIDMNDAAGELQLRSIEYGKWEYVSGIWNSGNNTSVQIRAVVERNWTNPGSGVTGDIWFDDITFSPLQADAYSETDAILSNKATYTTQENSDLKVQIGIDNNKVYISELQNKANNQNWVNGATPIPLLPKVNNQTISWTYQEQTAEDGHFIATFASGNYMLKWHAQLQESGPLHIWQELVNNSNSNVTVSAQDMQGIDLQVNAPNKTTLWRFNRSRFNNGLDGNFTTGVLKQVIGTSFYQLSQIENSWLVSTGELPLVVLEIGGSGTEGLYLAYDWNFGLMEVQTQSNAKRIRLRANLGLSTEEITCEKKTNWHLPGVFIGLYAGSTDDGCNQLKQWFWQHHAPASLRENSNEPLIEIHYNAFSENNFRYYLNRYNLPELGVGLIKMDYWWTVPTTGADANSGFDPVLETQWNPYAGKWPSGMTFGTLTKAKYPTIKNSLYMCDTYLGQDIAKKEAQQAQINALAHRIENWKIDYWRSDFDLEKANSYASHQGLLNILDALIASYPQFRYEHCSAGGSLKDFTTLRRMTFMTMEDSGGPLNHRMAFYSNSYMINPVQLKFDVGYDWTSAQDAGNINSNPESWAKYVLRSSMMGAMMACAVGRDMSTIEFNQAKIHWKLYNEKQRAILREGHVYHILPMPDGKHWDGMQFYNPETKKGSVFLFSHLSGGGTDGSSKRIYLQGLEETANYKITFQDRTNLSCTQSGKELMNDGLLVTGMTKHFDTEIIWIEKLSSTDIEENTETTYSIYPNPTRIGKNATLQGIDEEDEWTLYDIQGRCIQKSSGSATEAPTTAGIYFIQYKNQVIKWVVE